VREVVIVLSKVFVTQYYRLNVGFFLLIITLAFGFMSGVEHRALAEFFTSSPILALIPVAIWIIYALKVISFNKQQLQLDQNRFVRELTFLSDRTQYSALFTAGFGQFFPAVLYALFIMLVGIQNERYLESSIIAASQFLLLGLVTFFLKTKLQKLDNEIKISGVKKFFDEQFQKPLLQFYVEHLSRKQPLAFVSTKIFSGALLLGVTELYRHDTYDVRLIAMGVTFAFAANFTLLTHLHRFENQEFNLLRNLPLSIAKRIVTYTLVMVTICAPECIVILKNFPAQLAFSHVIGLLLFSFSTMLLLYALLFLKIKPDNVSRAIFSVMIIWILLILFSLPIICIAIANTIIATIIIRSCFYSFEFSEEQPD
jgi:hypothetical protein